MAWIYYPLAHTARGRIGIPQTSMKTTRVEMSLQLRESFGCQTYTLTWIIWWVEFLSSVPTKKLMRTFFPYLEFSCAIAFSAVQEVPKGTEGEARFLKLCFISRAITWKLLISKRGKLSYRKFAPSFPMLLATRIYPVTVWVKVARLCYQ